MSDGDDLELELPPLELWVQWQADGLELQVPALHVLEPIMKVFESYLGAPQTPIVAGQHILDAGALGGVAFAQTSAIPGARGSDHAAA